MADLGYRYIGHRRKERTVAGRVEVYVREGAAERVLLPRFDLFNHSPDGFNWGYAGSGPAQLALALLADALKDTPGGDQMAVSLHQQFKTEIIAAIKPESDWGMGRDYVEGWVEAALKARIEEGKKRMAEGT